MPPPPIVRPAVAILLAAACSTAGDQSLQVTRDTLPNGAATVHYAALPATTDTITPNLTIGTVDGDPNEVFGDIRAVEVDTAGYIYILDYQAAEVRAFDSSGTYLRTLTRSGRGPGEIVNANGMILSPDGTLWIQDHAQWTIIGIRLDGRELTRVPMVIRAYGYMWDATLDDRNRFSQQVSHSDEEPVFPPQLGLHTGSSRLYQKRFSTAGEALDSVFTGEPRYSSYVTQNSSGGWSFFQVPMHPRPVALADPAGGFWVTDGGSYSVVRLDDSGDTTMVISAEVPAAPVTDSDRQAAISNALEREPTARAAAEEMAAAMPASKPVLDQLLLDDEGHLWVRRFGDADDFPRYDIFTRDGTYQRSIVLAARASRYLRPRVVRGSIYTLVLDDLDVPSVVRAMY